MLLRCTISPDLGWCVLCTLDHVAIIVTEQNSPVFHRTNTLAFVESRRSPSFRSFFLSLTAIVRRIGTDLSACWTPPWWYPALNQTHHSFINNNRECLYMPMCWQGFRRCGTLHQLQAVTDKKLEIDVHYGENGRTSTNAMRMQLPNRITHRQTRIEASSQDWWSASSVSNQLTYRITSQMTNSLRLSWVW